MEKVSSVPTLFPCPLPPLKEQMRHGKSKFGAHPFPLSAPANKASLLPDTIRALSFDLSSDIWSSALSIDTLKDSFLYRFLFTLNIFDSEFQRPLLLPFYQYIRSQLFIV
jgi:hypothetical protein